MISNTRLNTRVWRPDVYESIDRRRATRIAAEIEALPPAQILVEGSTSLVCVARASQIPRSLREIGRLRELTFRAVGEGTGRAVDLDPFDVAYLHLIAWSVSERRILGAYRLVETDDILEGFGVEGLYTSTLFHYEPRFFETLGSALELGRAFVRPSHQRRAHTLPLLWRGIARFVAGRPQFRMLLGAASISADYRPESRALMLTSLEMHHMAPTLATQVRARTPIHVDSSLRASVRPMADVRALSDAIARLEPDGKGLPILLREYLKLGAKVVGFNRDAAFRDCLDVLLVVDLACVDPRVLGFFMGRIAAADFLAVHVPGSPSTGSSGPHAELSP